MKKKIPVRGAPAVPAPTGPKVLFAVFEAVPFMKTGGLGDVGGSLPQALCAAGCDARVIMPKFGTIPEKFREKMEHVTDFRVMLGWRNQYCGVEKLEYGGVVYYFLDNEYYFKREKPYGYFDDGERIAFFSKAVVESLRHLPDFPCQILHCNDWHTALAPVFLREFYRGLPECDGVRTVFTVHNIKFQGQYSDFVLGDILGLAGVPAAESQLRCGPDSINYMKGALCYSDALTTVSPTYAEEIRHPFYGEGLDDIFRRRENVLTGILNGIDTEEYDPSKDPAIAARFTADDFSGKSECKSALQRELGLAEDADRPLAVMIGRLTEQKGLDLVERVMNEAVAAGVQVAVLGTGDSKYEDAFRYFAWKYSGSVAACICFNAALSHRMYAGADMLLMPSLFEPCGLSQMIAMRYGTLPVVRETGGLKDSVAPYNRFTGEGDGFSFTNYNAHEMLGTLTAAADVYRGSRPAWEKLMKNAMTADFSWTGAAKKYRAIYEGLCPAPQGAAENG